MRYFIIFYTGESTYGRSYGCRPYQSRSYPSLGELRRLLATETDWNQIVITNIIELSGLDFDDFVK
jgi:hypothetical protein